MASRASLAPKSSTAARTLLLELSDFLHDGNRLALLRGDNIPLTPDALSVTSTPSRHGSRVALSEMQLEGAKAQRTEWVWLPWSDAGTPSRHYPLVSFAPSCCIVLFVFA